MKVQLKEVVIIKIFCDVIKVHWKEVVIIKIFSWYDKSTLEKKLFRKINCDVIKVHCTMGRVQWKMGFRTFLPQPPFSPGMIISEKIFGDCPLSSYTFDIYLGTS